MDSETAEREAALSARILGGMVGVSRGTFPVRTSTDGRRMKV
jgi:hypothetical protein